MPKINFNVPFVDETGVVVTQPKINPKKTRISPDGRQIPHVEMDAENNAILETVIIKDQLVKILNMPYEGDDKLPFGDRVKRGKLARKISTSSTANYTVNELNMIQELSAKTSSTVFLTQLDEIINGVSEDSDAPQEAA